jgi:hypothetical protein
VTKGWGADVARCFLIVFASAVCATLFMRALPVLAVVGFLIWLWCHPLGLIGVIIAELVLGFSQEFLYAIRQVCFQTSNIKGPISEKPVGFLAFYPADLSNQEAANQPARNDQQLSYQILRIGER